MFRPGAPQLSWKIWVPSIALVLVGIAALAIWSASVPGTARAQTGDPCFDALQVLRADDQVIGEKIRGWEAEKRYIQFFKTFPNAGYGQGYANAITEGRPFYSYRGVAGKPPGQVPTYAADINIAGQVVAGGWPRLDRTANGAVDLEPGGGREPGVRLQGRVGGEFGQFDSVAALNTLDEAISIAKAALRTNAQQARALEKCCTPIIRPPGVGDLFVPVPVKNGRPIRHEVRQAASRCQPINPPPGPTPTTPTTPTSPTPPSTCSVDDLAQPPSAGCYRVKVQVLLDQYPGDANGRLGVGVGSAVVQPGGKTITCLNPGDAGACFVYEDVAVNTSVSVTATPGSESPDPANPPDSAFEKFAGSCTGTGACALTPSSNSTVVSVYFMPAVATLTLKASVSTAEMSANGEGHVASTLPYSPVRCGGATDTLALPCSLLVRVNGEVQVQSDNQGNKPAMPTSFSSNCPARPAAPDYCDITLTSDQTVTANYG